eukprot:TCONS_00058844-protein
MELLKYLKLSSRLLQLPFVSKKCHGKESNESQIALNHDNVSFFAMFDITINCPNQAGLYNLYFHNCMNYDVAEAIKIDLNLKITERNQGTYLSAGQIPLPTLYFWLSFAFFIAAVCWTVYLRKRRYYYC